MVSSKINSSKGRELQHLGKAECSALPHRKAKEERTLGHRAQRHSGIRTEERMVTRLPEAVIAVITVITTEEFQNS